jgi:hypothetical protein
MGLRSLRFVIPLNPLLFLVCTVVLLVFGRTAPSYSKRYLMAAGIFVALILGLGAMSVTDWHTVDGKQAMQEASKLWIAAIGIPWLGLRIADGNFIRKIFKAGVFFITMGALFAVLQFARPSLLSMLSEEPGRGAGFWLNPNSCGAMCVLALLFSFVWPYENRILRIGTRVALILGLMSSMSRAAVGAALVAWFVYVLVRQSWRGVAVLGVIGTIFFVLPFVVDPGSVIESVSHNHGRAQSFSRLARGEVGNVVTGDIRWKIWQRTSDVAMDNWEFGCGLTCMARAAHIAGTYYVPHNYYIYVLGTGGVLAIAAFVCFIVYTARSALAISNLHLRALSLCTVAFLVIFLCFDSSVPGDQFFGITYLFLAVVCAEH